MRHKILSFALACSLMLTSVSIPSATTTPVKLSKKSVTLNIVTNDIGTVKQSSQIKIKKAKNIKIKKASYKSLNKKIATVTKKGKVTAKKTGKTKIKVTIKYKKKINKKWKVYNKKLTYTVKVKAINNKIKVTAPTVTTPGAIVQPTTPSSITTSKPNETPSTHSHFYRETARQGATCDKAGFITYECVCGETLTKEIPATGHKFSAWTTTKLSTCTEKGEQQRTCTVCGKTETREKDALGHNFVNKTPDVKYLVSEATCTEPAKYYVSCSRCDEHGTEIFEYGEANGHQYGPEKVTKPMYCYQDGEKQSVCEVCGDVHTETIPATGHKFGPMTVDKEATKTEDGEKSQHCLNANCTARQNITKIPKLDSDEEENNDIILYEWDVSEEQNEGVIAYITDTDNDGFYELHIKTQKEGSKMISASKERKNSFLNLDSTYGTREKIESVKFDNDVVAPNNCDYLFMNIQNGYSDTNLDQIVDNKCFYNLERLDVSNVTSMKGMFKNAGKQMTTFKIPENWDTSKVTDMSEMFSGIGYNAMTTFTLGNSFDSSHVTDMSNMFKNTGYKSMTDFNIKALDTSKVTDMSNMFNAVGHDSLTIIDFGTKFITDKVINMDNMFNNAMYLSLSTFKLPSTFNTQNVKSMNYMFYDLGHGSTTFKQFVLPTSFVTNNLIYANHMFDNIGFKSVDSKYIHLDLGNFGVTRTNAIDNTLQNDLFNLPYSLTVANQEVKDWISTKLPITQQNFDIQIRN